MKWKVIYQFWCNYIRLGWRGIFTPIWSKIPNCCMGWKCHLPTWRHGRDNGNMLHAWCPSILLACLQITPTKYIVLGKPGAIKSIEKALIMEIEPVTKGLRAHLLHQLTHFIRGSQLHFFRSHIIQKDGGSFPTQAFFI